MISKMAKPYIPPLEIFEILEGFANFIARAYRVKIIIKVEKKTTKIEGQNYTVHEIEVENPDTITPQ